MWKLLTATNTLAYFNLDLLAAVKRFMVEARRVHSFFRCVVKATSLTREMREGWADALTQTDGEE